MASSTTTKVAAQTGAAKDDLFTAAATGLTEDSLGASLAVLANDPGSAKLYSLLQNYTSGTTQMPVVTSAKTALGATVSIAADGTLRYDGSTISAGMQSLAQGELATDSFTYTIRMANGALSTASVSLQVAGTNDAPTLLGVAAVDLLDTAADDTPAAVTGQLAGSDVDHGAKLAYSLLSSTGDHGTFSLGTDGAYSFTADADKIDALRAGETLTASYTVTVTDEFGAAAAPVTLSFNLVGANDTAEISGQATGAVAEDGVLAAAGQLSVSDRDTGEASFAAPASLAGAYGDFSFDAATGAWAYALRNGDANVQALAAGQTVQDVLRVSSFDGSAFQDIVVDIAGAAEPVTPPPVVNPVSKFMVTHGTTDMNGRNEFTGFDSNDQLVYAKNLDLVGFTSIDTDGDHVVDATDVTFSFKGKTFEVVLVGFTSLTAGQILATNE